jgi:hypothetical protein
MNLKDIGLICSIVMSLISLAVVFIKGGMFLKASANTESEVLGLKNRVKENRQSARKMVYDDSGAEKFVRAEKFDEFCNDHRDFQNDMAEFRTDTKVTMEKITTELKNMNKTLDRYFNTDIG